MPCDKYKKWDLGEYDDQAFQAHLPQCSMCQKQYEADQHLLSLAKTLQEPVLAPKLWQRIENTLQEMPSVPNTVPLHQRPIVRWLAAAILIMGLGLAYQWTPNTAHKPSCLLTHEALAQVESTERDYIASIEQLEKQAQEKLPKINSDLSYLYRDKLSVIDYQISHCKDAIAENPGNAHVRRYMLAALQDKQKTLQEILDISIQ